MVKQMGGGLGSCPGEVKGGGAWGSVAPLKEHGRCCCEEWRLPERRRRTAAPAGGKRRAHTPFCSLLPTPATRTCSVPRARTSSVPRARTSSVHQQPWPTDRKPPVTAAKENLLCSYDRFKCLEMWDHSSAFKYNFIYWVS